MFHCQPRFCPACGGPSAEADATACGYCGGPLSSLGVPDPRASAPCWKCAIEVGVGASFCPQCGEMLERPIPTASIVHCPGCAQPMAIRRLRPRAERPEIHELAACESCGGIWCTKSSWQAVLEAAEIESRAAEAAGGRPHEVERFAVSAGAGVRVEYRRCVECGTPMMRRNFARISGVVVDECSGHGVFFDRGELDALLRFVRSGGLGLEARRRREELERKQRAVAYAATSASASAWAGDAETSSFWTLVGLARRLLGPGS